MALRRFATVLGVVCLSGIQSVLLAESYTETLEFSEDFENGTSFYLETLSGSVAIEGVAGNMVVVKAIKNVRGDEEEAREFLDQLQVEFKKSRDRIDVITEFPGEHGFLSHLFGRGDEHHNAWVDFEISIPTHLKVVVDATSADVKIKNIKGDIALDLTSGNVYGENLESDAVIDGTSGRVELRRVGGDVVIDNTSGEAVVIVCGGNVKVDKTSGNVSLRNIEGDVEVDGTSCNVQGEEINGYITLNLISGDVDLKKIREGISHDVISGNIRVAFENSPIRESQLSSISGDVTLLIKDKSDLDIDLESISGQLRVELEGLQIHEISKSSLRARTGDGQVKVLIDTVSGDVEILANDI